MIDLNENDVYKNDKITIWGKWWIPNYPNNLEIYGILEIIANRSAVLEGICFQKKNHENKDNILQKYQKQELGFLYAPKIFGTSNSGLYLTLLNYGIFIECFQIKFITENNLVLYIKAYVDMVVVGDNFIEDLKFKALSLNYEYCLKNLSDIFEEIKLGGYKILINKKYIKIEYNERQNFFKLFEIIEWIVIILSSLAGYILYPTGIEIDTALANSPKLSFLYLRLFPLITLDISNKEIFRLLPLSLKDSMITKIIIKIIGKILSDKRLRFLFFLYFKILEAIYDRSHVKKLDWIFLELFRFIEYYENEGKKEGKEKQSHQEMFENFLKKVEEFLGNYKLSLSAIVEAKYRKFILESYRFLEDIPFSKDNFKEIVVHFRNYITHFNEKRLKNVLKKISNNLKFEDGKKEIDYEKSFKVMCSLILRLKILCDITLLKEIKSIFEQILEEIPYQKVELEYLLDLNTSIVIANILLQYGLGFSRD
jgi:hypothetical protein